MSRPTYAWLCIALAAGLLVPAILGGCAAAPARGPEAISGELIVFHAGSLAAPLRELSALFEAAHPGVRVKSESGGSVDLARKIADSRQSCDVFGSADTEVVGKLLVPRCADFNIEFAANELVIAYTGQSRRGGEFRGDNWWQVLLSDGVAFGRADPDRDPLGYRTLMLFQLAEKHYGLPGLAGKLRAKDGDRFVRPKEAALLAMLKSAQADYLFLYRSVARQHGLRMLVLPDEINLKSQRCADLYRTARVEVRGAETGEPMTQTGSPITYSVTILRESPNRRAAEAYVALLLSPTGQEVLARCGQPAIVPARSGDLSRVPDTLKPFCR